MDINKGLSGRPEDGITKLTVADRAKLAIQTFNNTRSGLTALSTFVFPATTVGGGGLGNSVAGWFSVAPRDFPYENVNAYNSSIVMACINYIEGAFRRGKPTVYRMLKDGTKQVLPNHRFINFLKRPNPYYNMTKLMSATLISYYLDGNGYWFKERGQNGLGATKGLYYIPHFLITAKAEDGGYISRYEYSANGKTFSIPVDRIVHIRNGLDPYNPLSGRRVLAPVMSEVYTDEEAASFVAALVRNTAIPGIIIVPDTDKVEVDELDAETLKENFKRKFGGDNRGEPLIANFAAKITQMGFSPEQLQFKEVRRLPEERVAAQLKIPPMVAGLGAGLDHSTYNNFEEATKNAYRGAIIPLWEEVADEIATQLLMEFTGGDESYGFEFDYSEVEALQESQEAKNQRFTRLFVVDGITRGELREATGFEVEEARDNVFLSDIRRGGLPNATPNDKNPAKSLLSSVRGLLKASPYDNYDDAYELGLEAAIMDSTEQMSGDLESVFRKLAKQAETEARATLDKDNPTSESERIYAEIMKAIGLTLLIRAVWGRMAKNVEEGSVESVSLRIGVASGELWDEHTDREAKSLLLQMSRSYEEGLRKQTIEAIEKAIRGAEDGLSVAQIAKSIRQHVSGREMYPGIYKEAFARAKDAGATDEEASRAGEAKARRYRAKLIAETESRGYQNAVVIEAIQKGGVDRVRVRDGDGCGWRNHEDIDKADGTIRPVSEAKRYPLVHPNCKRRFYPIKTP